MFGQTVRFQEIGGNHRRNHARDGKAHQHRCNHRQAKILEELPSNTRHQSDRQKHCDNRECSGDDGKADFIGGLDRCLISRLAHSHVPDNVLDLHNRIVDKHASDQAQGKQRHRIECETQQIEKPECRDRR